MSESYPRPNTPEPITWVADDDGGSPIVGATDFTVRIRRADGLWYDWSDGTYHARGTVAQLNAPMPELDEPGVYEAVWPGGPAGDYLAFVARAGVRVGVLRLCVGRLPAPGDAMDLVADALRAATLAASAVAEMQAGLATAAALANVQADVVATAISVAALPTAIEIDTRLSNTHGSGPWLSATGFAVPGSAMTLTPGERAAIFSTPEGSPPANSYGAAIVITRKNVDNRTEVDTVGGGRQVTFDDDGVTPWRTRTLRDGAGGAIVRVR